MVLAARKQVASGSDDVIQLSSFPLFFIRNLAYPFKMLRPFVDSFPVCVRPLVRPYAHSYDRPYLSPSCRPSDDRPLGKC